MKLSLLAVWALALLAVALAGNATSAHAQALGRAEEILRQQVGAYSIAVAASSAKPYVGELYLWVSLADAATAQPVTDAQVSILAQRSIDTPEGRALVVHSPSAPGTYVAGINLDQPGTWLLAFQITSPLGEATTTLDLEAREMPRNPWVGTIGFAIVVLVLVLGGLYVAWSAGRRRRALQP
ncbi:MAG: hypothetical protein EXR55_01145 [Dehalococcoidia bacterium]|nr:hypothetical protein [Dehalococcoidia bacterium]